MDQVNENGPETPMSDEVFGHGKAAAVRGESKAGVKAVTPVWNVETGVYEPKYGGVKLNSDDCDYKNFHEDWLPK